MPLGPKRQIIHAHSLSGRLSTLVRPKILARSSRPGASPFSSRSVTVRGLFLPYLLQIETFIGRTGPLSHSVTARQSFPQLLQVENVHCVPINPSFDITRQPCRHRQIHAPAWGATGAVVDALAVVDVSIHAPAWGATHPERLSGLRQAVSIHAPAWDATT